MGASSTGQGPAAVRFAPYIEELQEFFASACLRFGSPEDIIALTERLESSQPFADDLSSMVRSIVLREGGEMPHSQLLEILAIAIGGPKMDHTPQQFGQPLRTLLSFLTGVIRKPWNEPPPEKTVRVERERGAVVPFPTKPRPHIGMRQSAAISAAADRAGHSDQARPDAASIDADHAEALRLHALRPHSVDLTPASSNPLSDMRKERKIPDLVGDPTPAPASAFDPERPADEAVEVPDLPGREVQDARSASAAGIDAHRQPALPQPTAHPVEPAHAPVAAAVGTPSWQLAAQAIRSRAEAPAAAAVPTPPANANSAAPAKGVGHGVLADSFTASIPGPHPATALNPVQFASSNAANASHTKPEPLPDPTRPSFQPHVPRTPAGMLVAGAALLVLAGIFAASLHRTPELVGKQVAASPAPPNPAPLVAATPASQPKPTATVPSVPALATTAPATRTRRVPVSDDEDADERGVAAPYSTPVPGQPAEKPSPYVGTTSQQQPAPVVRPPADEIASTGSAPVPPGSSSYPAQSYAGGGQPSGIRPEIHAYRSPDASIVGDLPRSGRGSRTIVPANSVDVSSGMMAGNLISAPRPDYPTLAKIAHIGGPVVMQAVIGKNGTVLATHVLSGHRLLRGAAQDAVRRWRYKPYVMDGHPVEVSTVITLRFKPNG